MKRVSCTGTEKGGDMNIGEAVSPRRRLLSVSGLLLLLMPRQLQPTQCGCTDFSLLMFDVEPPSADSGHLKAVKCFGRKWYFGAKGGELVPLKS